jgi:hypothetical protein
MTDHFFLLEQFNQRVDPHPSPGRRPSAPVKGQAPIPLSLPPRNGLAAKVIASRPLHHAIHNPAGLCDNGAFGAIA